MLQSSAIMTNESPKIFSAWFPIGFGTTGLLIGFVAGLSQTPVVGTLIPLLFTFIGGGSGLIVVRKPEHSRQVGVALASLAFMCIAGSIWGIHLREGLPVQCFVEICTTVPYEPPKAMALPDGANLSVQELTRLAILRNKLDELTLSQAERERIYTATVQYLSSAKKSENNNDGPDPSSPSAYNILNDFRMFASENSSARTPPGSAAKP